MTGEHILAMHKEIASRIKLPLTLILAIQVRCEEGEKTAM